MTTTNALNTTALLFVKVLSSIKTPDSVPDTNHRLVHLRPTAEFRLQSCQPASRYVQDRILDLALKSSEDSMRSLLGTLRGDALWSSLAGGVFEQLAHAQLSSGGTFPVCSVEGRLLPKTVRIISAGSIRFISANSRLQMPSCNRVSFTASKLRELASRPGASSVQDYLLPESPQYPGIDSLVLPCCMFQVSLVGSCVLST